MLKKNINSVLTQSQLDWLANGNGNKYYFNISIKDTKTKTYNSIKEPIEVIADSLETAKYQVTTVIKNDVIISRRFNV